MNESIFFAHLFLIIGFLFLSLKLGKSGLSAFIVLQVIFANLFVVKQMNLFGLEVTCSDAFVVGSLLGLNILQEFFGQEAAKKTIEISFLAALFFVCMSEIHLLYVPISMDTTHSAFTQIFASTPRIVFASIAVFFVVQQIDIRLFGWLQKRLKGRLALRVGISLFISQSLDTLLFSFAGLYGIVTSVFSIIVMSLPVKWLAIACSAPFTSFCRRIFKVEHERI